ncbi:alpha/beta hydrolase [Gammaproteobacteria bacterium ESL0073]|nr:alpha/beta hydrolase [Gammaproteobacteria bacterium ESL0073]AWM80113.1 alpha/beta hydrolase [Gammaproteobacteria bacterium ESL0073]AWM80123.1 alpha/beta hydrolase [Gammaproteobacteria bacterium ESL0073]
MKKLSLSVLAVLGTAFIATSANAAIDVSNIVTEMTSNQPAIVSVGGAGLLLFAAAAVFRYIKRAF